jgi:anti-sigma B factor antagonist
MTNDVPFDVRISHRPGTRVLEVRGEIDVASSPQLHSSISELIEAEPEIVVVDLSGVSFIDSTGLGVLVSAETQVREAGKSLRLVVTQPQIMKLLELTGLDEVFTVLSSTIDAVKT